MKTCFKCQRTLPLSEFYKHPRMADGHLNKCIPCTRRDVALHRWKHQRRYREYDRSRGFRTAPSSHEEWAARTPGARAAHGAVARALRKGTLRRESCRHCGAEGAHAHHHDYARPLDVEWLCVPCHRSLHAAERGQTPWRLYLSRSES